MTVEERLRKNYRIDPNTECWIWTGYIGGQGYGRLTNEKKPLSTHRLAYETWVGEIPEGLCVLHKCDVRSCINPDHLFLGTQKDNVQDCMEKGRRNSVRGSKHGHAKLTETEILKIRNMAGQLHKDIAAQFGVSRATIGDVLTRKLWTHI